MYQRGENSPVLTAQKEDLHMRKFLALLLVTMLAFAMIPGTGFA